MKVFITRALPGNAEKILTKNGFKVEVFKKDRPISKKEFIKGIKDADAIMPLVSDKVDREIIDSMPNCRVIANVAVGYNNVDVAYASSKGIIVTNTPDVLTDATADLAAALILSCARRIVEGDTMVRTGKFVGWKPQTLLGMDLRGKMLGIIGAGRIGIETAKRIKAFGTNICYYNNTKKIDFEDMTGAKKVSLNKLLSISDIISVHLPLNERTYHIISKDNLKHIKRGSIFINTARGEIVDEKELIKYIKSGHIFSAGFDVYENEPNVNRQLLKLKNVVLLPHIGSGTVEARSKMVELAAMNVINVLKGKKPLTPVK